MTKNKQRIHFIAIGGSLMHNLALALASGENEITGSDDEIYEPSRTKLANAGLLPEADGWFPEKITTDLDAVILGMHARKDNPELLKAQESGVPVYSFPEYIYQQSINKQRIVITGSHGKSTITSMIMHVLKFHNRSFDFAVGAEVPGFTQMVKISDAPIIIIEGDEYLSSALSPEPKFLKYHHHIVLISGIAWDHINVFPTEQEYIHQFEILADSTPKAGTVVYNDEDPKTKAIGSKERPDVVSVSYETPEYLVKEGKTFLQTTTDEIPLRVFGKGVQKDVQTRVSSIDLEPKALREQAVTVVSASVDALSKDAQARRSAIEARVADLQADAKTLPTRVQTVLNDNVATVSGTYADLAKRGENLVERVRKQQSTQETVTAAKTTTAKAKTTNTQAKKATKTTAKKTAKKASTTAKKTAKTASTTAKKTSAAPKSSAKATTTAAKKTASSAAEAATDAAVKVGD